MDYAVHNVPSYQHLQGKPQGSHLGSQSAGHSGTGTVYSTFVSGGKTGASEKDPGGSTHMSVGKKNAMDRSMTAY